MSCNSPYSHASRAHGPAVMPHQLVCPEVLFVPAVEQRVGRQARRIRGGCCICPGGGVWVPAFGGSGYDHDEEKRQQGQSVRQSWSTQQSQQRHSLPRSVSSDDEAEPAQYARPQVRFTLSPSPPSTPPANLRPQSPGAQSGLSGPTVVESNPSFSPAESMQTLPQPPHEDISNPPKPDSGDKPSEQPRKVPFRRIRRWVKGKCPLEIDWQS